jgi:hypothetical protein
VGEALRWPRPPARSTPGEAAAQGGAFLRGCHLSWFCQAATPPDLMALRDHALAVLSGETWPAGRSRIRARLRPWAEEPEDDVLLPALVITLELEGHPELRLRGCGPGDRDRLAAWVRGNERLCELVAWRWTCTTRARESRSAARRGV